MTKAGGYYEGDIVVQLLPDGRLVQLTQPFAYIDPFAMRWEVPPGYEVDGASIPQPLWSLVGSPFTGKYRDASVIHDRYCDLKNRPWGAVHRVFYDAMLTSGVSPMRAKIMYGAVVWGGPRWTTEVVNSYYDALDEYLKDSQSESGRVHFPMKGAEFDDMSKYDREVTAVVHYPFSDDDLEAIQQEIKLVDLAAVPEFIEARLRDRGLEALPGPLEAN